MCLVKVIKYVTNFYLAFVILQIKEELFNPGTLKKMIKIKSSLTRYPYKTTFTLNINNSYLSELFYNYDFLIFFIK